MHASCRQADRRRPVPLGDPLGVGEAAGTAAHEFMLCSPEACPPDRWAPLTDLECLGRGTGHGLGTARAAAADQTAGADVLFAPAYTAPLLPGPDRADHPRRLVRSPTRSGSRGAKDSAAG